MARPIKPGSTSQSINLYILDATTGLPYTGTPAFDDAGISLNYKRGATGTTTAITPATLAAETTAYSSGGFKSLGGSMARLDLPNAAVAAGADNVLVKAVATAWKAVPMDIPLNFITETEIQASNNAAIVANGLDHLVAASVTGADVADGSISARLASKSATTDWDSFNNQTDSLEAIHDAQLTAAAVNAEVVDALNVDTYAEPAQGTPAATTSLAAKIGFIFKAWRNRHTQTATEYSLYNYDAVTVDHKATFSDDATTADRGEVTTGP